MRKRQLRLSLPFALYGLAILCVPLFYWIPLPLKSPLRFALGEGVIHGAIYLSAPLFLLGVRKKHLLGIPLYIFFVQYLARTFGLYAFALDVLLFIGLHKSLAKYPLQKRLLGWQPAARKYLPLSLAFWSLLIVHIFFLIRFSHLHVAIAAPSKTIPWWFHAIFLNSLAEELFYRGFFFSHIYRKTGHFFTAALLTSLLYAGKHFLAFSLAGQAALTLAAGFYLFAFALISCSLFSASSSLFPSLLLSSLFHGVLNSLQW